MTESYGALATLREAMNRTLGLPDYGDDAVIRSRIGKMFAEFTGAAAKAKLLPPK